MKNIRGGLQLRPDGNYEVRLSFGVVFAPGALKIFSEREMREVVVTEAFRFAENLKEENRALEVP